MRRRLFLFLVCAAIGSAMARDVPYPPPDCDDQVATDCIARLISFDFKQHVAQARLEALESAGTTLCIPPRYLELWDEAARRESENFCGLTQNRLDAVGRYFGCSYRGDTECRRPNVGVALEGGGSKSAPFALGVLAGLQRQGVLDNVDIIGSASGGTYAAYYYFARILDEDRKPRGAREHRAKWFVDCYPAMYEKAMPKHIANAGILRWCKEAYAEEYVPLTRGNAFQEQVPHQYQVKVGQDLFSPWQTLKLRGTRWYDIDWLAAGALVTTMLAAQIATVPAHFVMHGLFDTPGNFAPTREAYRAGIERAYGHSPESWNTVLDNEDAFGLQEVPSLKPVSEEDQRIGTRYRREWTLDRLENSYNAARADCPDGGNCGFPLWIMSTSSSPGRSATFWLRAQPRDMQRFAFELGPRGHGSGLMGFLDAPPPVTHLRDAVGMSAAFLDDQQRAIMSKWWLQFVVSAGIFTLNLEWGTDVENFNVEDRKRDLYHAVPWPIYWFPQFQGLRAPYVRVSDGGNVDNLGLVALLRRGVRTVVASASTDDLHGGFPSLCKLKNELELEIPKGRAYSIYKLHMPSLQEFDKVCNKVLDRQEIAVWGEGVYKLFCAREGLEYETPSCEERWRNRCCVAPTGYDLWNWPYPVLEGCVVRRELDDADETRADTCTKARHAKREISRLLIIKPAIDGKAVELQLDPEKRIVSCHWGNDNATIGSPPHPDINPGMNLPCVTLAFLALNARDRAPPCRQKAGTFPQNEFVTMTLNSSYTLFGAYYDLGRHYAGQINRCGDSLCPAVSGREPVPACQ